METTASLYSTDYFSVKAENERLHNLALALSLLLGVSFAITAAFGFGWDRDARTLDNVRRHMITEHGCSVVVCER